MTKDEAMLWKTQDLTKQFLDEVKSRLDSCKNAALECLDTESPTRTQVMLAIWTAKIETYQEILQFRGSDE